MTPVTLPVSLPKRLCAWYAASRRDLPWRVSPSPYHVWISEIMLQQTRIEAVIPYYLRFITALPDVKALAAVDDDILMKLWQGLGYYSRARNLKKAAQIICDTYGGELPADYEKLLKLPGIGAYTAGAIASLSFGLPSPAVDGNVLRVIARFAAFDDDVMLPETKKTVTKALSAVYPEGADAGNFTASLMELGQTVCIPGTPKCELCVLNDICLARQSGRTNELPVRSKPKARRIEERTILLLEHDGRYALRKRGKGLLEGLWEFPGIEGAASDTQIAQAASALGVHVIAIEEACTASHVFTHVEWHMRGCIVHCENESDALVWASPEEIAKLYAVPTALRAFADCIGA